MWRQVVAQSPGTNAASAEVVRYDVGWKALNTLLKAGRSLSGHERNCCFLNTRGQRFADVSAAADIDFDDDGRVLALSDWDFDGDLDFWIANRTGPQVRFLRNDAANDHHFVAFRLEGVNCNRDAIGARIELNLSDSDHPKRIKTLRAGEGYLAQSSKWLHFGLGDSSKIESVVVRWPNGSSETISGVVPNQFYQISEGAGGAEAWEPPTRNVALAASKVKQPESSEQSRIVLIAPIPAPNFMSFTNRKDGQIESVISDSQRPRLVNVWASWCQPCIMELNQWNSHRAELEASRLEIVTINIDEPAEDRVEQLAKIDTLFESLNLPFVTGYGTEQLAIQLDVLQRSILRRQQSLPVPSSFLIDGQGNLRVIYKGPVDAQQLVSDARLLDATPEEVVAASIPYPGRWLGQPAGSSPNQIAVRFVEGGFIDEAERYIRQLADSDVKNPAYNATEAQVLLGAICSDQDRLEDAAVAFRLALVSDPRHRQSHIELAEVLKRLKQPAEAALHFKAALDRRGDDPELRLKLALAYLEQGEVDAAITEIKKAIDLRPSPAAYQNLGNAFLAKQQVEDAVKSYEMALEMAPSFAPAINNLAWLKATHESVLDAAGALELAEALLKSKSGRTPGNLDTVAAAYAAAGRFEEAVQLVEEAIQRTSAAGGTASSGREERLSLYRENKPYREN